MVADRRRQCKQVYVRFFACAFPLQEVLLALPGASAAVSFSSSISFEDNASMAEGAKTMGPA